MEALVVDHPSVSNGADKLAEASGLQLDEVRASCQIPLDIAQTAGKATLDYNPAHFNPEYAQKTQFKKPLVHGVVPLAMIFGLARLYGLSPDRFKLKFTHPVFLGDHLSIGLLRIPDDGESDEYNFAAEARLKPKSKVNGQAVPVIGECELSLHKLEKTFLDLESDIQNRNVRPELCKILQNKIRDRIAILNPNGEVQSNLPPIAEISPGYQFVTETVVTDRMIEATKEITGTPAMVELFPPFSVSRLLASLGGEDGHNATTIFYYLDGELTHRQHALMADGSPYITSLTVESVKPKYDNGDRLKGHSLTTSYWVRDVWGRLIGRGHAGILAACWPYSKS